MKQRILCLCTMLILMLSACAAEPPQERTTEAPMTLESQLIDMVENSAYAAYAKTGTLGVLLNEPFEKEPTATVTWREGEYDRAYIIPHFVGSYVNLFGVVWDEEGGYVLTDKAVQSTYVDDGCVIFSALERPEGMPMWYLEIEAPNGECAGFLLEYNGNTGTPAQEYFSIGGATE
ncbi:MAG: hypothetical protein ACI3VU_04475 [Faecousia sp.]